MYAKTVPHGVIRAAETAFWGALGDKSDHVANTFNSDPAYAKRVAFFAFESSLLHFGWEPTSEDDIARRIMGRNFSGRAEAEFYFGENWDNMQVHIPFTPEFLKERAETHFLCLVPRFSLSRMFATLGKGFLLNEEKDGGWILRCSHASEYEPAEWYLINKTTGELVQSGDQVSKLNLRSLCYILLAGRLCSAQKLFDGNECVAGQDHEFIYSVHWQGNMELEFFRWKKGELISQSLGGEKKMLVVGR